MVPTCLFEAGTLGVRPADMQVRAYGAFPCAAALVAFPAAALGRRVRRGQEALLVPGLRIAFARQGAAHLDRGRRVHAGRFRAALA